MRKVLVVVAIICAVSGLAATGYFVSRPPAGKVAGAKVKVVQFDSDEYSGTISIVPGQQEETVTFRPAVRGNDDVVKALQATSKAAFHDQYIQNTRPVVEVVNEVSYVTFTTVNGKDFYLLFKNDRGEVGSATFWRETLSASQRLKY